MWRDVIWVLLRRVKTRESEVVDWDSLMARVLTIDMIEVGIGSTVHLRRCMIDQESMFTKM